MSALTDAGAALLDAAVSPPGDDDSIRTSLQTEMPQGCFHGEFVISRMPAGYSPLDYPPAPEMISGQIDYCSATRFVIQTDSHLAWRDGPTLHVLWYWKDRSRPEALWYRLDRGALTAEEGRSRRRPSPAHFPGRPGLSGGYALGIEYVGGAPRAIGIFAPQLRTLLGLDISKSGASLDGVFVGVAPPDCTLRYAKERDGAIWRVSSECPEETAKFYPASVWQAGIKDIRPIAGLTIPSTPKAPQVHNRACEGVPEACTPWGPLTSAP